MRELIFILILISNPLYASQFLEVDKNQTGYTKPVNSQMITKEVTWEEASKHCGYPCGGSITWIPGYIYIQFTNMKALKHEFEHYLYGPKHREDR
jgi:hypothetical protein